MTQLYDIIGDIHGQADLLLALLKRMGYEEHKSTWIHPERKVIFVGDFIDRGPKQIQTVMIARRMVEAGTALAVIGNHEFNAIAWFLPDPDNPGDYLRSHCSDKYGRKNRRQHAAFLAEVEGKPEHREIIEWFLTLPLWLELPELRVVHACWHPRFMKFLSTMLLPGARLHKDIMPALTREPVDEKLKDSADPSPFKAAEMITKGLEIPLPPGFSFKDKGGDERFRVRVRWWDRDATNYRTAAHADGLSALLPDIPIPSHARIGAPMDRPVFFGHYWLKGQPGVQSEKAACVDYSAGIGGPLCAYRWDGENTLKAEHFCWVEPRISV